MSEKKSKPSKDPTLSPEILPVTHDRFFTETFQAKRLAEAFLRNRLPGELVKRLDLDGLTIEPRHITDKVFKELITDVVYRVPVKGTPNHVDDLPSRRLALPHRWRQFAPVGRLLCERN